MKIAGNILEKVGRSLGCVFIKSRRLMSRHTSGIGLGLGNGQLMRYLFSSRMLSPSHFEPEWNGPKRYGPSAIQPSVGDAGAPVFTFIGKHSLISEIDINMFFIFFLQKR